MVYRFSKLVLRAFPLNLPSLFQSVRMRIRNQRTTHSRETNYTVAPIARVAFQLVKRNAIAFTDFSPLLFIFLFDVNVPGMIWRSMRIVRRQPPPHLLLPLATNCTHASMSSRSRYGNCFTICFDVSPSRSSSITSCTRTRMPRTQGCPPHCLGLIVIRSMAIYPTPPQSH